MNIKVFFKLVSLFIVPIILSGCEHQKKSKKLIPELGNQIDVFAQFWDSPLSELEKSTHAGSISSNLEFTNKSKKIVRRKSKLKEQEAMHNMHELEAKLADIPILIQSIPLFSTGDEEKDDKTREFCLGYYSQSSSEEIVKFYNAEMERLGWQQKGSFLQTEPLLIFEKPHKICAISIRSEKYNVSTNSVCIFIFLGQKKEQAN